VAYGIRRGTPFDKAGQVGCTATIMNDVASCQVQPDCVRLSPIQYPISEKRGSLHDHDSPRAPDTSIQQPRIALHGCAIRGNPECPLAAACQSNGMIVGTRGFVRIATRYAPSPWHRSG